MHRYLGRYRVKIRPGTTLASPSYIAKERKAITAMRVIYKMIGRIVMLWKLNPISL